MCLGFFSSQSLVSPTLACAELREALWGWLKRKKPLERGLRRAHPSVCVGGEASTFVFCMAELEPGAQRLVQSQPQGWGALAGGGGSFEEMRAERRKEAAS